MGYCVSGKPLQVVWRGRSRFPFPKMSFDYIRGKEKRRINVRGRDMFIAIGLELAFGLRRAEMAQDPPHHLVSIRTPPARAG